MEDVYFISGLAADRRLFQYLTLKNIRPHFIRWIIPEKNESWEGYAGRLSKQIRTPDPVIVGLSMGGMAAIEISKLIPVRQLILISSAKTGKEIPPYFRLLCIFRGHEWIPFSWLIRLGLIFGGRLFGATCRADRVLLKEIIRDADETFFRWAWQRVASWKNEALPAPVFHIHGNRDCMLPLMFVKADVVIKGGTHLMVVNKADEISGILQARLDDTDS